MQYIIAVPLKGNHNRIAVATWLQKGYDDSGLAGDFKVLQVAPANHVVLFNRDVDQDAEYLSERMQRDSKTAEQAACEQLAAELAICEPAEVQDELESALKTGKASVFCFGYGVTLQSYLDLHLAEAA